MTTETPAPLPPAEGARLMDVLANAHPDDDYADDDSGSLSRLVDLDDPDVIAVLEQADVLDAIAEFGDDNLTLTPPFGEKYFIVRNGKAGAGKTIHLVKNNHVSKTFESFTHTNGRRIVEREFKFLTESEVELLLDAGFTHCRICADRAHRAAALTSMDPIIESFEDLAQTAAKLGIEVRLISYDITDDKPKKPRTLWTSMPMVVNEC